MTSLFLVISVFVLSTAQENQKSRNYSESQILDHLLIYNRTMAVSEIQETIRKSAEERILYAKDFFDNPEPGEGKGSFFSNEKLPQLSAQSKGVLSLKKKKIGYEKNLIIESSKIDLARRPLLRETLPPSNQVLSVKGIRSWSGLRGWINPQNLINKDNRITNRINVRERAFLSLRDLKDYADDHPDILDPLNLHDLTLNLPSQSRVTYTAQETKPVVARSSTDGRYKSGDPVFKYRFNIKKLDLFNQTTPDSTQLEKYFGLTKNEKGAYVYRGGATLMSGGEIANTNREPDFFEYLAFGIKASSLGHTVGDNMYIKQVGFGFEDSKRHLMQIAANVIDQYDINYIPTEILYKGQSVMGTESFPYLAGVGYFYYIPLQQNLSALLQPFVWNPSFNVNSASSALPSLRIRAEGRFQIKSAQGPNAFTLFDRSSPAINLNQTEKFITKAAPTALNSTSSNNYLFEFDTNSPAEKNIGFPMPYLNPVVIQNNPPANFYGVTVVHKENSFLCIEYWNGSEWKTYQTINAVFDSQGYNSGVWPSLHNSRPDIQRHLIDPRTARLGMFHMWRLENYSIYKTTSGKPGFLLSTQYNVFTKGQEGNVPPSFINRGNDNWGYLSVNKSGSSNPYYFDPDGVVRPADFSRLDLASNPLVTGGVGGFSPIHLNSTFDSVASLGVVFRDLPFKSLNFTDSVSADFRLLDLFTVNEGDLVYGKIDLHYSDPNDLIYLLDQGKKSFYSTGELWSAGEAQILINQLKYNAGLYRDKILRHISDFSKLYASVLDGMIGSDPQLKVKERSESVLRLVTDHLQTDTYNFLLELKCHDESARKRSATYRVSLDKKSAELILLEKL